MRDEEKGKERKKGVPVPPGVFGLLLLAYHGNNCRDCYHLGSIPQGLMIIKARR